LATVSYDYGGHQLFSYAAAELAETFVCLVCSTVQASCRVGVGLFIRAEVCMQGGTALRICLDARGYGVEVCMHILIHVCQSGGVLLSCVQQQMQM
jgi:hypothetical protein